MNDLISFLISGEAILVYIIAFVISVIYVVASFVKNTKQERIKRQNTVELNRLVEEVKEEQIKRPAFIFEDEQKEISKPLVNQIEVKQVENIELSKVEKAVPVESVNLKTENVLEKEAVSSIVIENNSVESNIPAIKSPENTINVEVRDESSSVGSLSEVVQEVALIEEITEPIQKEILQEEKVEFIQESVLKVEELEEVVLEKKDNMEEISYTSIEPAKEEAKQQLAEITEKLEKEENIELTEFERMQEDTAIISLDELMKKAGELYEKNEEVQYSDEGNEPISLADLEKRKQEVLCLNKEESVDKIEIIEQLELDDVTDVEVTSTCKLAPISKERKFKSSPVISPVYGLETNRKEVYKNTELELENTANFEKLDAEIRKTNQFMAALKELQKKLD